MSIFERFRSKQSEIKMTVNSDDRVRYLVESRLRKIVLRREKSSAIEVEILSTPVLFTVIARLILYVWSKAGVSNFYFYIIVLFILDIYERF